MKKSFIFWVVSSIVIMIILPWITVTFIKGDASMAICFILFYFLNPFYSILIGIRAGKAIKQLWSLPFISASLFLGGTWLFFSFGESTFIRYAGGYLILGLLSMLFSKLFISRIRKK